MKLIPLFFLLSLTCRYALAFTEWYCKPNVRSGYRPIASFQCSEMGEGPAYCRTSTSTQIGRCGDFQVNGDQLQATYEGQSGKTHKVNIAPLKLPPETVDESIPTNRDKGSEVTRTTSKRVLNRSTTSPLSNRYPPRTAKFSERVKTAEAYSNKEWLELSDLEKANYILEVTQALVDAHGLDYNPRILTCKAVKESCFRPQSTAPGRASTAAGLSQVTVSTARDLFNRGGWFESKVPGFKGVRDGRTYYNNMAGSMVAQLEIGMAILHQKALDNRTKNIKTILARYYGTKSSKQNNNYANSIYSCAECIKGAKQITHECLRKAHRSCIVQ